MFPRHDTKYTKKYKKCTKCIKVHIFSTTIFRGALDRTFYNIFEQTTSWDVKNIA